MIQIQANEAELVLVYSPDYAPGWVSHELESSGEVTLSRVFTFENRDVVEKGGEEDDWVFRLGELDGDYFRIPGRILSTEVDILLHRTLVGLGRKAFIAERGISIFRRLEKSLGKQVPEIRVGGDSDAESVISDDLFKELVRKFPNTSDMNRYANNRVLAVLDESLPDSVRKRASRSQPQADRELFEQTPAPLRPVVSLEYQKFEALRDTYAEYLKNSDAYNEGEWQKLIVEFLLLLFPKYVAVLEKVPLKDTYSDVSKTIWRQIDVMLVDAVEHIDILEVKQPFETCLLSKSQYRDNYVPKRELSGTIMQLEKYIFHLQKWGSEGEVYLNKKYVGQLPDDLKIRITNPSGLVIAGRNLSSKNAGHPFDHAESLDFELIRRKYSRIVDIITYDDLFKRIENVLERLQKRST